MSLHCGLPHPDLLLAVLTAEQMQEIEIYARIEPIGSELMVSRPVETPMATVKTNDIEARIDAILTAHEKIQ